MIEKTLIIVKPDGMRKNLVGTILDRFAKANLVLKACKMVQLDEPILRDHYDFLVDKPFFPAIVSYMTSAPVVICVWEGEDAVANVRRLLGPTDSREAPKGTIRGDFGKDKSENVVHASDSVESAQKEMNRFFKKDEIFA